MVIIYNTYTILMIEKCLILKVKMWHLVFKLEILYIMERQCSKNTSINVSKGIISNDSRNGFESSVNTLKC